MIIDTHTHIYLPEFDNDREKVVQQAKDAGVEMLLLPNIDVDSISPMKAFSNDYSQYTRMMMGLHPSSVGEDYLDQLNILKQELDANAYVAVGEIGMDLYWDKSYLEEQRVAFRQQCMWAIEKKLPISIHSRSAHNEVISVLKSLPEIPKGVFHCFGGSVSEAEEVISMSFCLGIGGVVSFKNSKLRNVLKHVDPTNIVLETDAPYLAPHPLRGKRNEPAYLKHIISTLVEIYNLPEEKLVSIFRENTRQLFQL